MIKKYLTFLILIFSFLTSKIFSAEFDIKAKTAILQDYLSGEILFEKEPDLPIFPASDVFETTLGGIKLDKVRMQKFHTRGRSPDVKASGGITLLFFLPPDPSLTPMDDLPSSWIESKNSCASRVLRATSTVDIVVVAAGATTPRTPLPLISQSTLVPPETNVSLS